MYNCVVSHWRRAQIRSKKLNTDRAAEKAKFEQELLELDKEMEGTQAELNKLQLLEQEVCVASSITNMFTFTSGRAVASVAEVFNGCNMLNSIQFQTYMGTLWLVLEKCGVRRERQQSKNVAQRKCRQILAAACVLYGEASTSDVIAK